jgi:NAD(P)H-hydrate repair Nnr-like enzyme with NAD(P)H-hydrate dehydratase domain
MSLAVCIITRWGLSAGWQANDGAQSLRCLAAPDWLPPRRPTSHKGDHGKLVIIGGDRGTAGAIRMSGEAALRAGAGLVRVLTHPDNIAPIDRQAGADGP